MARTLEERFWAKVDKSGGPDACRKWTGAVDSPGYGAFNFGGRKRNTHRIAYELTFGAIDRNKDIMHSCDNRLCCNPAHLSAGSRLENVRDAVKKERHSLGERTGTAKLSDGLVKLIKLLLDRRVCTATFIGQSLGLGGDTVGKIERGETWKHVTLPEVSPDA